MNTRYLGGVELYQKTSFLGENPQKPHEYKMDYLFGVGRSLFLGKPSFLGENPQKPQLRNECGGGIEEENGGDLESCTSTQGSKDVKKCNFFYYIIIGKSVIRAFQHYAQHPISHYGQALKIIVSLLVIFLFFSLT